MTTRAVRGDSRDKLGMGQSGGAESGSQSFQVLAIPFTTTIRKQQIRRGILACRH
ncbi:GDP-mannose pyrophosphatase [Sesbania bispinosa]|nr:GDP-mannose pyrophosphatase [Sesbania bispinosa]